MSDKGTIFCIDDKKVASKVIDGEAILINLSSGFYYSMNEVGGRVWSLLGQKATLASITKTIESEYDVTLETVRSDVSYLLAELSAEELILTDNSSGATPSADKTAAGEKIPYIRPNLEKYSDMADMLALDPPLPDLK